MSNGKKYCIFSAQYLPHMGGVERYTYNLARQLIKDGNEVVVVTSNIYHLPACERMDGILVYRVPCFNLLEGRYPVLKPNKVFRKIHRRLKREKFDMFLVNTRFYPHSLYGMILAKSKKCPCITVEHGTSHLSVHSRFWDTVGGVFEHMLTRVDRLFCKNYYGVSEACNQWLRHFHIQARGVVYNSIDLEEIQTIRDNAVPVFRAKYHIPEDAIVITFTGRLLEEKGLPSLLNVMDEICQKRNDVYLFIAGDGDLEEEVRRRKTEHIIPLGRIDFEKVVSLLNETDIFCLPSFSEGFSTSILEAAACQCYVVTTARGGAKELLINDAYGSVIPDNKEENLLLALERAIQNPEHRKKAVELTYERLKKCFTWEIAAKQVETICEKSNIQKVCKR